MSLSAKVTTNMSLRQRHSNKAINKKNGKTFCKGYQKKNTLGREIVTIPSDTTTIETVSEYLESEYW